MSSRAAIAWRAALPGILRKSGVGLVFYLSWLVGLGAEDKSGVSPQTISLPTGPGSIDGLGESFESQLNTGTYVFRVPMKLPPVRGAADPEFAIAYNSGDGNGPLGLGWKLSSPWIQRQTDKGLPRYDGRDTYITESGEELVALADGSFRNENEGVFTRYQLLPDGSWLATRRDGAVMKFGASPQSRLAHPGGGTFRWMLESVQDTNGNRCEYSYIQDAGQIYLKEVRYGLHTSAPSSAFVVEFHYGSGRPDSFTDYRGRFRSETRLRLVSVTVSLGQRRIRHWQFGYDNDPTVTLLRSFTVFGDNRSTLGAGAAVNKDYLPPITFTYEPSALGSQLTVKSMDGYVPSFANGEAEFADINRDGLPDLLIRNQDGFYESSLNTGDGFAEPQAFQQYAMPPIVAGSGGDSIRLMDLRGDGSVECFVDEGTDLYFREFASPTEFGPDRDYVRAGNFPLRDPQVQMVDINNDRAIDFVSPDAGGFACLLTNPKDGTSNVFYPAVGDPAPSPLAATLAATVDFTAGWRFADMNGDRMLDLVAIGTTEEGGTVYYPSLGYGEFDAAVVMPGGPSDSQLGPRGLPGCDIVDVNGDGLGDLVYVDSGVVRLWRSVAGRSFEEVPVSVAGIPDYAEGRTAVRFADVNANGSTDIVWNDPSEGIPLAHLDLQPGGRVHQLKTMQNGMGRSLEIEYSNTVDLMLAAEAEGNPWTLKPPFPMTVVTGFLEGDGSGNFYRTSMMYRDGYYDGAEREFRGFRVAVRTDWGDDAQGAPTLVTHHVFDTGDVHEALKGKPLQVERRTAGGELFDRVTSRWNPRVLPVTRAAGEQRTVTFAHPIDQTTVISERGQGQPVTLFKEYEYDDYGNETRLEDHGRQGGDWDDERVTIRSFTASHSDGLARWILSLPVTEVISDEVGKPVAHTRHYYDSSSVLGSVTKGNPTAIHRSIDADGTKFIVEKKAYDTYGNPTSLIDPLGSGPGSPHSRTIGYDTVIHTHPTSETIHVGGDSGDLEVSADYDEGLGVMASSSDFNGNPTTYRYDTFGRLEAVIKPGDSASHPTETYQYLLGQAVSGRILNWISAGKRETAGGGTVDSRMFFDGLGRKIMTRSEGSESGQAVVTDHVVFNARKAAWKTYLPYFGSGMDFADGGEASTETRYDALGRSERVIQPDTGDGPVYSMTRYEPLVRFIQDEEQTRAGSRHSGAGMRYIHDGLLNDEGQGRLRQVVEVVKINDDGTPSGSPAEWVTSYAYDLLDNLTGITDSQLNVKTMRYDALSRMTFMDDPNRGTLDYEYDDASNLTKSTDAKGQVIKLTYDGANRILTEDYLDAAGFSPDVAYHYDKPGPKGGSNLRGQLAWVSDLSGQEHLSYDERGRIASRSKRLVADLTAQDYLTKFSYDSMDRLVSESYPDGDDVTYGYNPRGLLSDITNGIVGPIVPQVDYAASVQTSEVQYSNGVATHYNYDERQRLQRLKTLRGSSEILNNEYKFDGSQNITQIIDHRGQDGENEIIHNSQTLIYDDLYRLTEAEFSSGDSAKYRYDRIGNMLEKGLQRSNAQGVLSGNVQATLRYGEGGAGPHAVTSAVGANPQDASRVLTYDDNGNLASERDIIYSWDFKDRLKGIETPSEKVLFFYDYLNRRVGKQVFTKLDASSGLLTKVSLYVSESFEIRDFGRIAKYIKRGTERCAVVTKPGPSFDQKIMVPLFQGWNLLYSSSAGQLKDAMLPGEVGIQILEDGSLSDIANSSSISEGVFAILAKQPRPFLCSLQNRTGQDLTLKTFGGFVVNPNEFSCSFSWSEWAQAWEAANRSPLSWQYGYHPSHAPSSGLEPFRVALGRPDQLVNVDFIGEHREVAFLHSDHISSIQSTSGSQPAPFSDALYFPFGEARSASSLVGHCDYSFTQSERDIESGLFHMGARLYSADMARFVSVDPLALTPASLVGFPQKANAYAYCENRPSILIDPTGATGESSHVLHGGPTRANAMELGSTGPDTMDDFRDGLTLLQEVGKEVRNTLVKSSHRQIRELGSQFNSSAIKSTAKAAKPILTGVGSTLNVVNYGAAAVEIQSEYQRAGWEGAARKSTSFAANEISQKGATFLCFKGAVAFGAMTGGPGLVAAVACPVIGYGVGKGVEYGVEKLWTKPPSQPLPPLPPDPFVCKPATASAPKPSMEFH
ncbi:MAG: hypothetical protein Fur0032_11700 [Terrimicrobiaceae bacterium]